LDNAGLKPGLLVLPSVVETSAAQNSLPTTRRESIETVGGGMTGFKKWGVRVTQASLG